MVCTEDHDFTVRLQKHQVAKACTENSMNHENHKFLHRSFFLLQLRWGLFHIVTFKSTVVLLMYHLFEQVTHVEDVEQVGH